MDRTCVVAVTEQKTRESMSKSQEIVVPRTGGEVTIAWLKQIVEEYEKAKDSSFTVSLSDLQVDKATKPGDSFNSELVKVDSTAEIYSGKEKIEEKKYNFILKFESLTIFSKEANRFGNAHLREFYIYKEVVKELRSLEGALEKNYVVPIPELIYGHHHKEDYVLVMKNVSIDGYATNDKRLGLNHKQLKVALRHLAYLHALTYTYDKKFSFLKKFPVFEYSVKAHGFFNSLLVVTLESVYHYAKFKKLEFASKIENQRRIVDKLDQLKHNAEEYVPYCLNHGDFWNNNMLFQYAEASEDPTGVIFIDWQVTSWTNPVIDLHYLFYSSTTRDTRKEHLESLLKLYHTTFSEVTNFFDCPAIGWSYENFKKEFDRLAPFGFVYGAALIQGTLSKTGETLNQAKTTTNPRSFGFGFKTALARNTLKLMAKPSMSSLISSMARKMLGPTKDELIEGKNEVLESRIYNLIEEASENGIFDNF